MNTNGTAEHQNIKNFDELDGKVQELIKEAVEARKFAYCPYSNFSVGAALRTKCGRIFRGCNIENGAHSPGVCAERTAIVKAVSEGFLEFDSIAIIGFQEEHFTSPCGVCRQTLSEFAKRDDIPVYLSKPATIRVMITSVFELLPYRFCSEKLKKQSSS